MHRTWCSLGLDLGLTAHIHTMLLSVYMNPVLSSRLSLNVSISIKHKIQNFKKQMQSSLHVLCCQICSLSAVRGSSERKKNNIFVHQHDMMSATLWPVVVLLLFYCCYVAEQWVSSWCKTIIIHLPRFCYFTVVAFIQQPPFNILQVITRHGDFTPAG